jgi:Flagellar hook-length control protein FliK
MSAVSQIRMQAAVSHLNTDSVQLGAKPRGSAAPAGFESFLSALDRSSMARLNAREVSDKKNVGSKEVSTGGMQNLPKKGFSAAKTTNSSDSAQVLVDPAMATRQHMLNQAITSGQIADQNPMAQAMFSGQVVDQNPMAQAMALLKSLQNQATNAAQTQSNTQTAAQIASAIQMAAQKSGISLPPEVQTQLNELLGQAAPGVIKLIGVETDNKAALPVVNIQSGQVDPAKASTIQNLTEIKGQKTLDGLSLDKGLKQKVSDNFSTVGISEKSAVAKVKVNEIDLNLASQNFDPLLNPTLVNIQHQDSNAVPQNRLEVKAADVSLASGPLHAEIVNSAKSGGGRIMLELTPPEQGTIRIDLRINANGQAHLIVEGASEATKSRLDQGGQSLKNEFSQMGLNLSLDLRQGNQSQQYRESAFGNKSQDPYASLTTASRASSSILAAGSVISGDNRGNSDTVHLYA